MISRKIRFTTATICLAAAFASQSRADWPEFRGPTTMGIYSGKSLPTEWSEDKNVTWRKEIHGLGWSTPVILDGKAWFTTAAKNGTTMSVICVDPTNGDVLLDKVLVTTDNPEPLSNKMNTYATPTAVVELGRVYLSFGNYGTFCLNTETFELIWQRRDILVSHWRGPGSSVAMWQNLIILTHDGADQQYHIALDKTSGETVWRNGLADRSLNELRR